MLMPRSFTEGESVSVIGSVALCAAAAAGAAAAVAPTAAAPRERRGESCAAHCHQLAAYRFSMRYEGHRTKHTRRRDHGHPSTPHARHAGDVQGATVPMPAKTGRSALHMRRRLPKLIRSFAREFMRELDSASALREGGQAPNWLELWNATGRTTITPPAGTLLPRGPLPHVESV